MAEPVDDHRAPDPGPRYFRFVPMFGGHAGDADEVVCHVHCDGPEELIGVLRQCGAEPELLPEGYQPPQAGVPVTADTIWPLHGAPGYRDVSTAKVNGIRVAFSTRIVQDGIVLVLALFGADGDDWAVTAADWDNASIVEAELLGRGLALCRGDWLGRAIDGGPEAWPRR